jgi:protein-S-isoprenylcysteine O-methyltransferase Ste14
VNAFIIIWILWFASEIFLNRMFRSGSKVKDLDKGSLTLVWCAIFFGISLAIASKYYCFIPIANSPIVQHIGLFVIVFGIAGRFYAINSLGKFFTVNIAIHEHHLLKKNGLYKYIRHPSYTFSLLSFTGFGLSLNSWIALTILMVPVTAAMLYRIVVEEKVLKEQFGTEYSDYIKNTYRLLPFIY